MKVRKLFLNGRKRPMRDALAEPPIEGTPTISWMQTRKTLALMHPMGGKSLGVELSEPVVDQINASGMRLSGLEVLPDGRVVRQVWLIEF